MPSERELSDVDRLHQELFGSVPAKAGTAYEKVAAIVLAAIGWQDVTHDQTERADGMRADHQLDITCRDAKGEVRRLLIECKEWDTKDVGQDEMIKLYSVRDELGASDAAMITKQSFTKGARDTAVDHNIAMLRLRPYDPAIDDGTWLKQVSVGITMAMTVQENVEMLVDGTWRDARELGIITQGWMDLFDAAEKRTGNLDGLYLEGLPVSDQQDPARKRVLRDDDPFWIHGADGLIEATGLQWTERVVTDTTPVVVEAKGKPRLVLQQLDENGELTAGKVIVDEKLLAWKVGGDGRVVEDKPTLIVPTVPAPDPPDKPGE